MIRMLGGDTLLFGLSNIELCGACVVESLHNCYISNSIPYEIPYE